MNSETVRNCLVGYLFYYISEMIELVMNRMGCAGNQEKKEVIL